jgi:hypothetical protein
MNLVLPIFGAILLFALGYLVGVKRYMRLIAGYRPGRIKDEEAVARSFRIWCFGGGVLVLLVGVLLQVA